MKLISWNVNGIRANLKKNFIVSIKKLKPDILCIQETKAHKEQLNNELGQLGYEYEYWNSAKKKGYSGVLVLSKKKPLSVFSGMNITKHDNEGRLLTLDYDNFYLINVYVPNSKRELLRLDYRQNEWDIDLLKYISNLDKIKPVIICGDFNVAHKEIDLKNPKTNRLNPGFTDEERLGMDNFLRAGFIDTFRYFYPDTIKYTWWSYMAQARAKNIGWRIDYFLASKKIISQLRDASIYDEITGSDHCPISLTVTFS